MRFVTLELGVEILKKHWYSVLAISHGIKSIFLFSKYTYAQLILIRDLEKKKEKEFQWKHCQIILTLANPHIFPIRCTDHERNNFFDDLFFNSLP